MNRAEKRRQRKLTGRTANKGPRKKFGGTQQALELAIQHYTAGDLPEAEDVCRDILQTDPNQPVALQMLGVIALQSGKNDIAAKYIQKAIETNPGDADGHSNLGLALQNLGRLEESAASYRKAIDIRPDFAEAHNNLGNTLTQLGRLKEAVIHFQKAIQINPNNANEHNNLGNTFKDLGKFDEALASYRKAIQIRPDFAEAHSNLGNLFGDLQRLDEAAVHIQKAIILRPDYADAHNNLGVVLQKLGRLEESADSFHKAIDINPDYADAHNNLAGTLKELGRLEDSVESYHKAIDINPDLADVHNNLGNVLKDLGQFSKAKAAYDRGFHIKHGGPWYNATTFADGDGAAMRLPVGEPFTSTFKLRDTIDQLEYLIAKGRIDPSFQQMADRYGDVLTEIELTEKPGAATKLTLEQLDRLGSFHNRAIYHDGPPRIGVSTVNGTLDFKDIEDRYLSSPVSVTTLDGFLTPETFSRLRDFCLESTIFFTHTGNHLVSSRLTNGFNCDLLYQIAEEVKERFPRVLGDHELANMWVYRYNNQSAGVTAHTDEGAVTFNFWITPDDANLLPDQGGLIVYAKDQPYGWDWRHYNANKHTPAVGQEIADFLADAETVTIPYRENRAVLFHSNLFHKSDQIHFKDGFENRRMNIVFLFGQRKG
jgi:tetratricopeptide (TPR) repeat protein